MLKVYLVLSTHNSHCIEHFILLNQGDTQRLVLTLFDLDPIDLGRTKSNELDLNGVRSRFNVFDFKFTREIGQRLVVGTDDGHRSIWQRFTSSLFNYHPFEHPFVLSKGHLAQGDENEYVELSKIHFLEHV